MDDQQCPRCKTTKYRNPSLKLMVNVCGHSLCESCIEMLFIRGSGECHECHIPLRRSNFRIQLFEDALVEKEVDIRRRILKVYNKKEEDFVSLREYNDYLEEMETIVYNLANDIDVETTKKQVEQYKSDNKDSIKKNKSKMSRDEELIAMLIDQEQQSAMLHRVESQENERNDKLQRVKSKQALIDDLMFCDGNAEDIMANHKAVAEAEMKEMQSTNVYKKTVFTSDRGSAVDFMPMQIDESPLYTHSELTLDTSGPAVPNSQDIIDNGYLLHIRRAGSPELGGGYHATYGCQRALMDAFNGLTFTVPPPHSIENIPV